jgi:hypothetical protein
LLPAPLVAQPASQRGCIPNRPPHKRQSRNLGYSTWRGDQPLAKSAQSLGWVCAAYSPRPSDRDRSAARRRARPRSCASWICLIRSSTSGSVPGSSRTGCLARCGSSWCLRAMAGWSIQYLVMASPRTSRAVSLSSVTCPAQNLAPRAGLEPATYGLTVPPAPSVQSRSVMFGAVLSTNFKSVVLSGDALSRSVRLHKWLHVATGTPQPRTAPESPRGAQREESLQSSSRLKVTTNRLPFISC